MPIIKKLVSLSLLLAFILTCPAPPAYAEDAWEQKITVSYSVEPDGNFGAPAILNPPQTQTVAAGEEFVLAENLRTDATLALNKLDNEIYIGQWDFSGWTVPDHVAVREQLSETESFFFREYTNMTPESEIRYYCVSYSDTGISGRWTFIPQEKLSVPDISLSDTDLPLADSRAALDGFWPEREASLNRVFATGLISESLIRYMNENITKIPLRDKSFASVELSGAERIKFMAAVKETYLALTSGTDISGEVRAGIDAVLAATDGENAGMSTAFVVYCAEKAGLLEGKSRCLLKTADIRQEYDFLKNTACADFITMDELSQIFGAESGESTGGVTFNNSVVGFARDETRYDVSSRKNSVQPGDLMVFKDELDNPVTLAIVDSVEGHSISYVLCRAGEKPTEYTLTEESVALMLRTGAKVEIVGLRSCDSSRIIYEFLISELDMPESAALGILGNMYYESEFSTTALGDGYTSFGLCQWHNDRFLNLVIFCMKNNYNIASLEGQLRFLAHELKDNFPALTDELSRCEKSPTWAKEAAYRFCEVFEQPADFELNAALRGTAASGALWKSYSELFPSENELENLKLSEVGQAQERQSDYVLYTVRAGDTLSSICAGFGIDYNNYRREIISLNSITDETMIYEGQTLVFWRSMIQE